MQDKTRGKAQPTVYRLKAGVQLLSSDLEEAQILYFGNRYLIRGPFGQLPLQSLFEWLRMPRSIDEIASKLPKVSTVLIDGCLNALIRAQFVESDDPSFFDGDSANAECQVGAPAKNRLLAFIQKFHSSRSATREILKRLQSAKICLLNVSDSLKNFELSLRELQLNAPTVINLALQPIHSFLAEEAAKSLLDCDLIVVHATWFDTNFLRALNRWFFEHQVHWTVVMADTFGGTVGPVLGLADGPCFDCLYERRKNSIASPETLSIFEVEFERRFKNRDMQGESSNSSLDVFNCQLANVAALEVLKYIMQGPLTRLVGGAYDFDFLNHRTEYHPVLAQPFCAVCGSMVFRPSETTETWFA